MCAVTGSGDSQQVFMLLDMLLVWTVPAPAIASWPYELGAAPLHQRQHLQHPVVNGFGGRGAFLSLTAKELENRPRIGQPPGLCQRNKGNRVAPGGLRLRGILMRIRSIAATLATAALLGAAAKAPATAATAGSSPAHKPLGNKSLAKVLTSDGNQFDKNWNDYDIVTEAALAVIAAKPDSPVTVLTKGKVPVTAFIPSDWSFRQLAKDLTGTKFKTEKQVFNALAGLGIDTIETVVLTGTEQVVIGPADLDLSQGAHTIVYAWGSAKGGILKLAVQTISGMHSAPSGVPGGTGGQGADDSGGLASTGWAILAGGLPTSLVLHRPAPRRTR